MRPALFLGASILFLILSEPFFSARAQAVPDPQMTIDVSDNSLQAFADGLNAFGIDLFHRLSLSVTPDKNLVFSPYSISTALAMAWTGARNNTETQMVQVLHFDGDRETIQEDFQKLRTSLESAGQEGGFDLDIANSLWVQDDDKFLQPFLDGLKNDFNAPPQLADFKKDPESARLQINQWVEDKTRQKIKNLFSSGAFDPSETRMVIVNAVYFKSDWLNAFKPENTQQLPFHFPSADVPVSMMQQQNHFMILENDQAQILEMPYQGDQLSMVVILPRGTQFLPGFEQKLDSDTLNSWLSQMSSQLVDVKLPKFKFTYGSVELKPFLTDMGMTDAFDKLNADFSGMIPPPVEKLRIDKVVHKAYVCVDEKGTEAAAATGVIMTRASVMIQNPPQPILFNADHPFLFLIRDKQTNTILFMGRMADPRIKE